MNQEKIMKGKLVTTIILLIATVIALIVFIALYVDETRKTERNYRAHYRAEMQHLSGEIEGYLNTEGGYDTRYNMIIGYSSCAASYAFLMNDFEEQQKAVNELYTCFVKYPEQMSEKLEDVKTAVDHILDDLDKGYDELREIIDSIDKKGN